MVGEIKGWEGSGKFCGNQGQLCVWRVIFSLLLPESSSLPPYPFSRMPFGAHGSPISIFTCTHTATYCFPKSPALSPYPRHSCTGQCCQMGEEVKQHHTRQPWRSWPFPPCLVRERQAFPHMPVNSSWALVRASATMNVLWAVVFPEAFHEEQRSAAELEYLRLLSIPTEIVKHEGLFKHKNQHNGYWDICIKQQKVLNLPTSAQLNQDMEPGTS